MCLRMDMNSPETFKIYCGNLSSSTTDEDLHAVFSPYGTVVEAVVMTGKNFGFVHMSSEEEGIRALCALNHYSLNGERLVVLKSINSRRASVVSTKQSFQQNIIGKGISSLDDFESFSEPNEQNFLFSDKVPKPMQPPQPLINSVPYSTMNPVSCSNGNGNGSDRPSPLMNSSPQTPEHVRPLIRNIDNEYSNSIKKNKENSLCGVCREPYDIRFRVPKILSCNHTFCSNCLSTLAKGSIIECPHGCPYITNLVESSISGLTTNQTVSIQEQHIFNNLIHVQDNNKNESSQKDVCCNCLSSPPSPMCFRHGHQLLSEADSILFLKPKLQSLLECSVNQLRIVMTIRASLKERMQSTFHSLSKFSEELKMKIEGEELEESMQHTLLTDLNHTSDSIIATNSINDLLSTCTKVQSFAQNINSQYSQCAAKSTINEVIDSIVLKLKGSHDVPICQLGFSQEEAFSMASSLEENANKGNFANVLLIYLLCDLLTTRHNPNPIATLHSYFSPSPHSFGSLPSQGVSPVHEMNGSPIEKPIDDSDSFDINLVLKTTEAIESNNDHNGSLGCVGHPESSSSPPIVSSALSLGLSNVSLIGSESLSNGVTEIEEQDQDKEDGIKPSSYLDALKKPAKSVTPKSFITSPKIIANPAKMVKFPHCWMAISIDGVPVGRIVFQLRPDKAPKMCDNFIGLCTGRSGYGYKGSHFFKSGEGFLVGGDVENDDGSGGYSVYNRQKIEADLCPLKDDVGMVRFKGVGTNESGRGMVGSQFMIWYTEREFKKFSFSLVFGRVVDGLDIVQEAANHNLSKSAVKVEECGAI